ncbi:hypothetical protein IWX75_002998 [Arthrobacter sp. CAN_A6]
MSPSNPERFRPPFLDVLFLAVSIGLLAFALWNAVRMRRSSRAELPGGVNGSKHTVSDPLLLGTTPKIDRRLSMALINLGYDGAFYVLSPSC